MGYIISLLFFYKDGFGIKWLIKFDIPLKKIKGMNPLIPAAMGYIISLLFFYKDGFGIK